MNETNNKQADFIAIYNQSYRLAAAVFAISNVLDQGEELRTKIKKLSLDLVSLSVNLKDTNFIDAQKLTSMIEKNCLELMSMLDIASVAGLISKMNGTVIKEEFETFIGELKKFSERFEQSRGLSVKNLLADHSGPAPQSPVITGPREGSETFKSPQISVESKPEINGNGPKRKDLRKHTILEFIKGHDNASIKDIVPNIRGCSEKTVQRELIELINEGKVKRMGERRWSRYSAF